MIAFVNIVLKSSSNPDCKTDSKAGLKPGAFVRLKGQPADLPDFILERYLGSFCWIRQQEWGQRIQWKVKVASLEMSVPESGALASEVLPSEHFAR